MPDEPVGQGHTQRDAETLWALGIFQVVLAIPVFIGTFYVEDRFAQLVNVAAGGVTFLVGAFMIWRGFWIKRHLS
jgi:hypothetical protein